MKYISTFELFEGYNKPRAGGKRRWSVKYKKKINCSNPKGFSQIQYYKRKRRGGHYKTESVEILSISSPNQELMNVLRDMSLDISDKDLNVQIGENVDSDIMVTICGTGFGFEKTFKYSDIKTPFLDIVDYMISEGFNIKEIIGYFYNNRVVLELEDDKLYFPDEIRYGQIYDIEKLIIKFKEL
jgi:hypothetical protein